MKVTIGRDEFRCDSFEEYERCIENVFLYKDAEIWISELGTRDEAKKAVLEFYQRKKLPVSMEWEEL